MKYLLKHIKSKPVTCLFLFSLPFFFIHFDTYLLHLVGNMLKKNKDLNGTLNYIDPAVNFMTHGITQLVIIAIVVLSGIFFSRKLYLFGRTIFISLIANGIFVYIMKHTVGRARPRVTDSFELSGPGFKSGYDSFPSGHTAGAFCIAYILSARYPKYSLVFYFLAVFTAFDRVKDGSHFPSDTIAGAIVGIYVTKYLLDKSFNKY